VLPLPLHTTHMPLILPSFHARTVTTSRGFVCFFLRHSGVRVYQPAARSPCAYMSSTLNGARHLQCRDLCRQFICPHPMILVSATFSWSIVCLLSGVTIQMLFTNHIASVGGTRIDLRRRRRRDGDKVHNPMLRLNRLPPDDRVQKLIEISACVVLFFFWRFGIRVVNRRLTGRRTRRMPGILPAGAIAHTRQRMQIVTASPDRGIAQQKNQPIHPP